jgi:hypothetical protein
METTFVYNSTTILSQAIDTFDPPTEKSIRYRIQITKNTDTEVTDLDVTHDGLVTEEIQVSHSLSNAVPITFTTAISGNVGYIYATPSHKFTRFDVVRNTIESEKYSENTVSGRNIQANTGMGIYFVGGANNMSIRQENNNYFGPASEYITSNVMGPIASLDEKLLNSTFVDNSGWISYNNNDLTVSGNYGFAKSSGQVDNCQYQVIDVVPGRLYIISGRAYYTTDNIQSQLAERSAGLNFIRVGESIPSNQYFEFAPTDTEQTFSGVFAPTTTQIYVMFGFGDLSTTCVVKDISVKEAVPFHTYQQEEGTMFVRWTTVPADTIILNFKSQSTNNAVYVDASNNVFVNSANCGAQSPTNRVVFGYSTNGIVASRNGAAIISDASALNKQIANLHFVSVPQEYSYMAKLLTNTEIIELSNG